MANRWSLTSPYAILAILTFINFLNYVDRQVLSGLVPHLKAPLADGGLALSSTQAGLLQSAFMVVHAMASIPLGIAADRVLRKRLIALGVGIWSVATAAAGFARTFTQLFLCRAAVGIGEAAYAPAATALISERFPEAARGQAMGIFQMGMVLGGGVGLVAGATVAPTWGWRAAFFLVGFPGLLTVIVALAIAEPRAPAVAQERKAATTEILAVLRTPRVGWVYAAGVLITAMVGAIQYWAVDFVVQYHYAGDPSASAQVGATFGPIVIGAAVLGTIGGSMLADRWERRAPGRGRLLVVALGPIAGAPFVAAGIWASSLPAFYAALAIGTALNSFYVGPVLATLHDVVPPHVRATASGMYFFIVHFLGDAISPTIVGFIADQTGSLRSAVSLAALASVAGGLCALTGLRRAARPGPA
jgi:MFS family permease